MADYKILKFMHNGDEYCISGGSQKYCIDYLAVGGGAGSFAADGGGGGAVCVGCSTQTSGVLDITIGCGGIGHIGNNQIGTSGVERYCLGYGLTSGVKTNGGDTSISNIVNAGGGKSTYYDLCCANIRFGGDSGSGYVKGTSTVTNAGNGGGGAGGNGCNATSGNGGRGGCGKCGYGGGGAGYGCTNACTGIDGGGRGATQSTSDCVYSGMFDATNCGGGGGGNQGNGAGGLVCICYPSDGSYGFTKAVGGDCCFEQGGKCVHVYTRNGKFVPDTLGLKYIDYLVVGGGGGGGCGYNYNSGGGGGGDVCLGGAIVGNEMCITVGTGGTQCVNGGCSKISGDICLEVIAKGGCGATGRQGGTSGRGCVGGDTNYGCSGGGGGGASQNGIYVTQYGTSCFAGGSGGAGCCGYGGGGGGGLYMRYTTGGRTPGIGADGGGDGAVGVSQRGCNATNCGGGGGGAICCSGGRGAGGVVDICYACDGSYGFSCATGGNSCYLCGNMCVHRFTSSGTFCIVS